MNYEKLYQLQFGKLYPNYVKKATLKGKTKEEVDEIITWLTGYSIQELKYIIESDVDVRSFFEGAPKMNEKVSLITGVICGIRIETIEDPLMKKIRYLDKLIDELSKGKSMNKILRESM